MPGLIFNTAATATVSSAIAGTFGLTRTGTGVTTLSGSNTSTWTIAAASGGIANFAANKLLVDVSGFGNDFTGGRFAFDLSGTALVLKYLAAPLIFPQFTSVTITHGQPAQFCGTGCPGQNYILLAATNLAPANWIPLTTNLADTNGLFQFADPQVTSFPMRFYRITTP